MRIKEKELKHILVDKDMNQSDLARRLNRSRSWMYQRMREGGKKSTMEMIAKELGVPLEQIAEYEDIRK